MRETLERGVEVGEQSARSYAGATVGRSSATIVPAIEASGVGYCICIRTAPGIVPCCWSWSKVANDFVYSSA
jgi:hypothetical protein